MTATATSPLKERLAEVENRLNRLRDERGRLAEEAASTKRAFAALPNPDPRSPEFDRASAAMERLNLHDEEIQRARAQQVEVLKAISGRPEAFGGTDGWAAVAHELDLERGVIKVVRPAGEFLRRYAESSIGSDFATFPDGRPTLRGPLVEAARDRRFIYPRLQSVQIGPEALAVSEFRQTVGLGILVIVAP